MPGHPKCYAQAFGNCRGDVTGEHYVSKSVLFSASQDEKTIRVSGLKFLKGSQRKIAISGLVGNTLCEKHNGDLSVFDAEGLTFFNAMERIFVPNTPVVPLRVNGDRLERWMLKVLLGGLYCGQFPVPEGMKTKDECPSMDLLRILFENDPFQKGCGLYLCHGEDGADSLMDDDVLKFAVLPAKKPEGGDTVIIGLRMWMFGIEFLLTVFPLNPLPDRLQPERATYRPTHIIGGAAGETLILDWGGNTEVREVGFAGHDF